MTKLPTLTPILVFMAALLLAACGDPNATCGDGGDCDDCGDCGGAHEGHDHAHGPHQGAVLILGDHAAHLEVCIAHDMSMIEVFASDADMKPVGLDEPPVLKLMHEGKSHRLVSLPGELPEHGYSFVDDVLAAHVEKGRFEVKLGGKTYTPDLPAHSHGDDSHAHDGCAHGKNGGTEAALEGGHGHVELKLHDDLGDLELWITTDKAGATPLDLPIDATITVEFEGKAKTVALKVRDAEKNADEDGNPNLRDGKTNYFIFPGDSGRDASWLRGAGFEDTVVIKIQAGDQAFETAPFRLCPHTH